LVHDPFPLVLTCPTSISGHLANLRTLNLYCTGEGGPAVIVEMSPHTAGYGWMRVQPGIALFTQVCWYDRAGYGWSDPAPPDPKDRHLDCNRSVLTVYSGADSGARYYILGGHEHGID